MKTTKSTFVVLSLVLLTTGALRAMENKEDISGTMKASCLVQVTSDPAIFPVNWQTIEALVYSSGVAGKAAREILEISPDEVSDIVLIEILESRPGVSPPPATGLGLLGGSPRPATSSRSRTTKPTLSEDAGMDEYMMEDYGMEMRPAFPGPASPTARSRSSSSGTSSSRSRASSYGMSTTTARRPGETTAQYEARRRAQAAARARAAAARSRTTLTTPQPAPASSVDGQTYLFGLNVNLPDDVKPAAKEFMSALVENLRHALCDSYDAHAEELQSLLQFAEDQRDQAQTQLAKATEQVEAIKVTPPIRLKPADAAVREQLEQIVDLSNLAQNMSFEEVVMELKNSVDPPLQIQPNWKDLLDTAELEQTTPSMMDPLTGIRLRKALEVLLAGVSSDFAEVGHVVDDGVIMIATKEKLPKKMVSRVYEIPALVYSAGSAKGLIQAIQKSIEPESWFDVSDTGEGTIGVYMGSKLAILQTDDVHLKIHEFLQSMTTDIPASTAPQIPAEMLLSENRNLFREKQNIEMEIARLLARQSAIEMRIAATERQIAAKLKTDPVSAELQQLVEMHASQLALMERQFQAGKLPVVELADIKEKLTRAKIELAQRHEQLSKSAGGDQLTKYNNELADKTIEFAEKTAALRVLSEQLGQAEQQFMAATVVNPRVSRIRQATRAFEIADQCVDELNTRSATLRPPVVSMLGGK